jgi:hypothetical protein
MVLNLWESRQFRSFTPPPETKPRLNAETKAILDTPETFNTLEKTEYLKQYSQHIADNAFYRITALGIQITCEDVGILGPLALFVFSLYSAITFGACYRHVKCAANELFENSLLIRILLETEVPLDKSEQPLGRYGNYLENRIPRLFLFLPTVACGAVIFYDIFAHLLPPQYGDPLAELIKQNRLMVISLDVIGVVFTLAVAHCNWLTFRFSGETKKVVARHSTSRNHIP